MHVCILYIFFGKALWHQVQLFIEVNLFPGKKRISKLRGDVTKPYYDKLIEYDDSSELKIKEIGKIFKVELLVAVKIMLWSSSFGWRQCYSKVPR